MQRLKFDRSTVQKRKILLVMSALQGQPSMVSHMWQNYSLTVKAAKRRWAAVLSLFSQRGLKICKEILERTVWAKCLPCLLYSGNMVSTSGGRSTSGSHTTQVPTQKHRLRKFLLVIGGTGSLYITYRILCPRTAEQHTAKNWQVRNLLLLQLPLLLLLLLLVLRLLLLSLLLLLQLLLLLKLQPLLLQMSSVAHFWSIWVWYGSMCCV